MIEKIACIGAGLIGQGWATLFACKGYIVSLYDIDDKKLEFALANIKRNIDFLNENGLLTSRAPKQCLNKIELTTLIDAVKDADYVQESVNEKYDLKKEIFKSISHDSMPNSILASSTSTLKMTLIQEDVEIPERCIVAHPWNPPHLMPLVDIIPGKRTSKETINKTKQFMEELGKVTVVQKKEIVGAVSNRLSAALWREAIDLINKDVVELEDIDKAVSAGSAFRWAIIGPNLGYHLGGGSGGIEYFLNHIGPTMEDRWRTLAEWTKFPENARSKIIRGIKNTRLVRERSMEEIIKWRDEKLVALLKILYPKIQY